MCDCKMVALRVFVSWLPLFARWIFVLAKYIISKRIILIYRLPMETRTKAKKMVAVDGKSVFYANTSVRDRVRAHSRSIHFGRFFIR